MKRKISKSDYRLLGKEFYDLEQRGHLKPGQAGHLLSVYEPTEKISFVQTLLVIGSVLVGVGVLSFIAGNWQVMPKLLKFFILFIATTGFYISGYKLTASYPRTARSLYYIGIFVYGASIFLIGQTFHLSGSMYSDFLLWGIGILPLAYYLKDKFIAASVALLFGLYAFSTFEAPVDLPYILFVLIPLLYWMNESRMGHSKGLFIANTWLALAFLFNIVHYFQLDPWAGLIIFFIIGLSLSFFPFIRYTFQAEWLGSIVYGISGLFLTFPFAWTISTSNHDGSIAATVFTVLFILALIFFLKIGSLPAILVTCLLIFRFYTDLSYDFMPKSLFFVIGGFILIGFGFWFEKTRRETVSTDEKNEA